MSLVPSIFFAFFSLILAVTVCNMNKARKSVVDKLPKDSIEYYLTETFCSQKTRNITFLRDAKWKEFRNVLLTVPQPCTNMFVACRYGGVDYNCSDLFNGILTVNNKIGKHFKIFRFQQSIKCDL